VPQGSKLFDRILSTSTTSIENPQRECIDSLLSKGEHDRIDAMNHTINVAASGPGIDDLILGTPPANREADCDGPSKAPTLIALMKSIR
jgi:hypothetical protein